ncbi:hypothetical protein F5Y11DRAFT_321860 [Daldinia sp. FL1419]|nr:hypothetical protein F5Y11DRAFT_321860 [Daldinia sp. FL1419]
MCRFWGGAIAIVGVSLGVILASCLNIGHASFASISVMGRSLVQSFGYIGPPKRGFCLVGVEYETFGTGSGMLDPCC